MNEETTTTPQVGVYRPNLCLYHASANGGGSAVKMNLHPAHDNTSGCIMLTAANQLTVGVRNGPNPTCSTFDWENAVCVKLDFNDLSAMIQVLRGECESVNDGRGLFHRSPGASTIIQFQHRISPVPGYPLSISRKESGGDDEGSRVAFVFSQSEATGLLISLEWSLGLVAFGIPMLIPRDVSAYRSAVREMRAPSAGAFSARRPVADSRGKGYNPQITATGGKDGRQVAVS